VDIKQNPKIGGIGKKSDSWKSKKPRLRYIEINLGRTKSSIKRKTVQQLNGLILTIGYFKRPTKNNRFVPIFNIIFVLISFVVDLQVFIPVCKTGSTKYQKKERF
jgi:hypothetical protein